MPLKRETTQVKSFFACTLYSLFLTTVLEGTRRAFATLPLYYFRKDIGTTIFSPTHQNSESHQIPESLH